jgi:hypothetical protein
MLLRASASACALFLAFIAVASTATAQEEPQGPSGLQVFAQPEADPSGSNVHILADCQRPANPGDHVCRVRLALVVNGVDVFDELRDLPAGVDGNYIRVPIDSIRDKAMDGNRKITMALTVFAEDGRELARSTRTDKIGGYVRDYALCGFRPAMRSDGGPVKAYWGKARWTMEAGVPAYINFRVLSKTPITATWNGLTYTIAPGSLARFDCVGFITSRGIIGVPMLFIVEGRARVEGKPRDNAQIASAIVTREGTFRSLTRERVDFTVKRNATQRLATLSVERGRTLQVSHIIGSGRSYPCTPGRSITVGRRGVVKRSR